MKLYYLFLPILIITQISCSQNKEVKLIPPQNGIYHTAFSTTFSSPNNVSEKEVPYFEDLVNKKIVWMNFANDWFNGIKFPESSVRNIWKSGAMPSIRMMPWSTYGKIDLTYSLRKIIDGTFDTELKQWANELQKTGIPVLIDFAGEPNGDWFPWSGINNGGSKTDGYGDKSLADGPEMYRDAYRHIIDLFRKQGVTRVTWVFHAAGLSAPDEEWNKMKNYYPGDDYIDWIGVSAYGPQRWGDSYQRFYDVLSPAYTQLTSISDTKPIAVLEFGIADYLPNINKALWIQGALYTVSLPEFSRIKAIGWWNSTWKNTDGTMSAIQIDSSPESLKFYKEGIAQTEFVSDYILTKEK